MKRLLLIVILTLLILGVAGLTLRQTVFKPVAAGIWVKSDPTSAIYLNGKNVGQTPYEDKNLAVGEVDLRLVPTLTTALLTPWGTKIKLVGGTQTIINWEFGETESASGGEIMTLEKIADKKTASLAVISSPDSSLVKIDGEPKGFTPVSFEKLQEGQHQIALSASGFEERNIQARLQPGFKLILNVKLAEKREEVPTPTPTPTPTSSPKPGKTTPTPSPKPTGKITPTPVALKKPYVTIKETPTGFLRVRSEPKTGSEITKVYPGESYPLVGQENGWYKITYSTGKEGWISGQYAEKFE